MTSRVALQAERSTIDAEMPPTDNRFGIPKDLDSARAVAMEFRTRVASGHEVLFVGSVRENIKRRENGRWRLSIRELELYLSDQLKEKSFGTSINRFVFCFEIADFELWGKFFQETADYTSYRPKSKEILSVGQLRWSDVKHLGPGEQLEALRGAIQASILKIGTKARKPRDFDYISFADTVDHLLIRVPDVRLVAAPAAGSSMGDNE